MRRNEQLWHTLDIGNMFGPTFGFKIHNCCNLLDLEAKSSDVVNEAVDQLILGNQITVVVAHRLAIYASACGYRCYAT